MKDKEMIEEMAQVIKSVKLYGNDNYERIISPDSMLELAKELLKYYQPKLPEGSVVLDRHEHQKYCAYKIIEPQIRGCLDRERELESENENCHEVLADLKTIIKQQNDRIAELEEQRGRQAYIIAEDLIQEKHRWTEQARKQTAKEILQEVGKACGDYQWFKNLCKEFGVEVEE